MDPTPVQMEEFVNLMSRIQNPLRGYVYAHLHDLSKIDDLIQEVSIVLWRKFGEYRPEDSAFLTWAVGIARNKIMQAHRQSFRSRLVFDDEMAAQLADCYVDIESELDERRGALAVCLTRLPETARNLIQLRYTQGLSFQIMAAQLGKKVNTVTMAVSRIRAALEKCIRSYLAASSGASGGPT